MKFKFIGAVAEKYKRNHWYLKLFRNVHVGSTVIFSSYNHIRRSAQSQGRPLTMESPPLVVGVGLEVFEEVRLKSLRACEVGGHDREESPASLAGVRYGGLVGSCLLHDLAVELVVQSLERVTVLATQQGKSRRYINTGLAGDSYSYCIQCM